MANLLQRIFGGGEKQRRNEVQIPFAPFVQQRLQELMGLAANQQLLSKNEGWVFACVQAIAQEVANIHLHLMRANDEGDDTEEFNSPALDLLNKVNPRMTRYELLEVTQSHQELEGNAFWFLARDKTKAVREIWPLRPDRVGLIADKGNPLLVDKYIYRQKSGQRVLIDATDVIHFKQFDANAEYPFPHRGIGTVKAAMLAIDTNTFSRVWNKNFFINSARPDFILTTDAKLNATDYDRVNRQWKAAHQGIDNANKAALLDQGIKTDKFSFTQKEMDFIKQLQLSRDEILAIFRVPKTVLGITEDVNRANAEASNYVFSLRTIKPKMQRFVDTLNEFLLPLFDDPALYFTFDSPVPEDEVTKATVFAAGINKWLTRNEIRGAEGLPPTENGDKFFGTVTDVPIDSVKPEGPQAEAAKPQGKRNAPKAEKKEKQTTEEVIKEATRAHITELFNKPIPATPKQLTYNAVEEFKSAWLKDFEARERRFRATVQSFFDAQRKRVITQLAQELKGLEAKEYNLKATRDLLPDIDEEVSALIDLSTPLYQKFVAEQGERAVSLVGAEIAFDTQSQSVIEFIAERAQFFAKSANDVTYEELLPAIREGVVAGESLPEISERVANVYDKTRDFRTERIARTETAASSNFANLEAYEQTGIKKHQWVEFAPEDGKCRIGGESVAIGEDFSNGLVAPPVHPNCVCTTIADFE